MGRCFLCQEDTELQCQNGHFYCCDDHLEAHGPCFPFEVVISEEFGRYFVATRDIKPLELVVVDEPALVGPATKTRPVCLECFSGPLSADSSDLCEQCQFPLCKSCSTSDDKRRFHREEECKILAGSSLAKEVCTPIVRRMRVSPIYETMCGRDEKLLSNLFGSQQMIFLILGDFRKG